jgi:phosphate/sulfate permease
LLAGIPAMLFFGQENNTLIVVIVAGLGAYMALNIGANDVATNMGPPLLRTLFLWAVRLPQVGSFRLFWGGASLRPFFEPRIIYQEDKIASARTWVPILVGIMAGAFSSYLVLKGLKKIIEIDLPMALLTGAAIGLLVWVIMIPLIRMVGGQITKLNLMWAYCVALSAAIPLHDDFCCMDHYCSSHRNSVRNHFLFDQLSHRIGFR